MGAAAGGLAIRRHSDRRGDPIRDSNGACSCRNTGLGFDTRGSADIDACSYDSRYDTNAYGNGSTHGRAHQDAHANDDSDLNTGSQPRVDADTSARADSNPQSLANGDARGFQGYVSYHVGQPGRRGR